LVRPANMIWPATLVFASMYTTLHGNAKETQDKLRFFVIAFSCIFVWQFVPQYMFTWLTSMALLCLAAPANATIKKLGSGYHGVGILNFSLDWNAIGQSGPLFTPWFASVNFYVGVFLGAWIIAPLLYFNNVFEAKKFPFTSTHPFDKNGHRYNQTAVIDPTTGSLNITAYEQIGPVYLSVTFAAGYFWSFIGLTAALSHVVLFYGDEIWTRFKASRSEEKEDIHTKMMRVYPEIPNLWHGIIFVSMLIISIILGYITEANLPWWGLLLAVALACIMVLPIGVIQAISNNQVGLNVITEMICGYVLPGRPIANVYFKCYGYMAMNQCLLLVSDLKLGHYMKIPPRSMFISQLWGTTVGCFVNFWVLKMIIVSKRPFLDGTLRDPTGQWTGYASQIFNTASIVWGLIGPARTFGADSLYRPLLWGFLIGIFAPFPFYLLHRKYPKSQFNLVNVPLICFGLSILPGAYTNFIIMGFITSFLSQYYGIRYNYVLSAALDSGTQIVTMVIFFCLNGVNKVPFPEWWGNNRESQ
ncbi:8845_t:CDS:10, partial [Ambispora leptoticha]